MTRPFSLVILLFAGLTVAGCGKSGTATATAAAAAAQGGPAKLVKLSQFGLAGSCAMAVGPDGTIHAAFSDAKEYGKPAHLYYRASRDGGVTWSDPRAISDDESVQSAGPCRVLVDGSGRVYAIWKTVAVNELLEGPNGYAIGTLTCRVLDGGTWSAARTWGDEHHPMTSWFAAVDGGGRVNVVYSRADEAVDWAKGHMPVQHANNLDQLVLDGSAPPKVTPLQVARHVLTAAEQDAASAAHNPPAYADTVPKDDGLWNLNGYVAADGLPRFLAERYPASGEQPTILRFDGQRTRPFHEYKGYVGNTFSDPPVLLCGADGREHVIRMPEATENAVVRDYLVQDGRPGDKTDVITNAAPTAKVHGWWAGPLAGGRMVAMAAVEPNLDVLGPTDLYVAVADPKGAWSKPVNVTDNAARATFAARSGLSQSTTYRPTYAEAATLKDGSVGVIVINTEHTISGMDTVGVTDGGRAVTGTSAFSTDSPYVSFVKVKG